MHLDPRVGGERHRGHALEDGEVLVEHEVLVRDQVVDGGEVVGREAVVGHQLVDARAIARLGLAHEEDGEPAARQREVEGEVHRRRRAAHLGEHVGLHERVLTGGDERIVVVAVGRLVDRADLPAVASDVVRADVRGLGGAEGADVHGGEVRGVEEVVGELQRAHGGVARCGLGAW